MRIKSITVAGFVAAAGLLQAAVAQDRAPRLYCWEQDGQKYCSDTLPASAVDQPRTEIQGRTLTRRIQVERALTVEERTIAAREAQEAAAAAEAQAARLRADLAIVESYETEQALREAYGRRVLLVEESIRTSQLRTQTLRRNLSSLLVQANELELQNKPVGRDIADTVQQQHREILRQQAMLAQLQQEHGNLEIDLEETVRRYLELKGALNPDAEQETAAAGDEDAAGNIETASIKPQ